MAKKKMIPLASHWRPGRFDVICARGRIALDHEGNRRFRNIVQQHLNAYSNSACKFHKSRIVSHIVSSIRSSSPEGGFVRLVDDEWYVVTDRYAREKVGQTFRDLLHTQYRSSTKAKARARNNRQEEQLTTHQEYSDMNINLQTEVETEPQAPGNLYLRMNSISGASIVSNTSSIQNGESSTDIPVHRIFSQQLSQEPPVVVTCVSRDNITDAKAEIHSVTKDRWYYDFLKQLENFLGNDAPTMPQEQEQQGHVQSAATVDYTMDDLSLTPLEQVMLTSTDLEPVPIGDSVTFIASL